LPIAEENGTRCFFSGCTANGGVKETRHWLRTKRPQRAKGSFHQQGERGENSTCWSQERGSQRPEGKFHLQHATYFCGLSPFPDHQKGFSGRERHQSQQAPVGVGAESWKCTEQLADE